MDTRMDRFTALEPRGWDQCYDRLGRRRGLAGLFVDVADVGSGQPGHGLVAALESMDLRFDARMDAWLVRPQRGVDVLRRRLRKITIRNDGREEPGTCSIELAPGR